MTFWSSEPPQRSRSLRLLFRDGLAAATIPFVAASIGFLPSNAPLAPSNYSRPALNQEYFVSKQPIAASNGGWLGTSSNVPPKPQALSPQPANAASPPGARIVPPASYAGWLGTSNFVPAAPQGNGRIVDNPGRPPGALIAAPVLAGFNAWSVSPALGLGYCAKPSTTNSDPVGQALFASAWASWAPDALRPLVPPQIPPGTVGDQLDLAYFGEPIISDAPLQFTLKPIRANNFEAGLFPALAQAPAPSAFVEWAPTSVLAPRVAPASPATSAPVGASLTLAGLPWASRDAAIPRLSAGSPPPANTDPALTALGFAPSPSFTGWTVDPPARLPPSRPLLLPHVALGALLQPAVLPFVDWSQSVQSPRLNSARVQDQSPLGAPVSTPPVVFAQWAADIAPRGAWLSRAPITETVLGALIPPTASSFVEWAPARPVTRLATAQAGDQGPVGTSLLTSAWTSWASGASRAALPLSRQPAADFVLPTTQPPPGVFADWAPPVSRPIPAPTRLATDSAPVGSALLANSFLGWSVEPQRQSLPAARSANDAFALAPLAQPPGPFAVWSVEPPRAWTQPYSRPDNQPVSSAVTLPPFVVYQQWSVEPARGTAVKSRPPGEAVLTGQFIPPPVLTGTPWQQDTPRVAQRLGQTAPDAFVGSALTLAGLPWATRDAPRSLTLRAPGVDQPFLGGALALATFLTQDGPARAAPLARPSLADAPPVGGPLAPALASFLPQDISPRAVLAARPAPADGYALPPVVYLTPFVSWSGDASRAPSSRLALADSAFVGAQLAPTLAPFLGQESPTRGLAQRQATQLDPSFTGGQLLAPFFPLDGAPRPAPATQPSVRDQAFALPPVVVTLPFVGWSTHSAPVQRLGSVSPTQSWFLPATVPPAISAFSHWTPDIIRGWIAPQRRSNNQFFWALTTAPVVVPARPEWCSPLIDMRSSNYAPKTIDLRSKP